MSEDKAVYHFKVTYLRPPLTLITANIHKYMILLYNVILEDVFFYNNPYILMVLMKILYFIHEMVNVKFILKIVNTH